MSVTPMHHPPKPPGYERVPEEILEDFAYVHGVPIRLPGPRGGWATVRHGSVKLCSLLASEEAW